MGRCDHHHHEKGHTLDEIVERCRTLGLRKTKALEEVVHLMLDKSRPLTQADIVSAPEIAKLCDQATVYRLLMRLEEKAIVRRLGLHDRAAHFVLNFPGEHGDYLICEACGQIEKLDRSCPVEQLEEEIAKEKGFHGVYHELVFFGQCPTCG